MGTNGAALTFFVVSRPQLRKADGFAPRDCRGLSSTGSSSNCRAEVEAKRISQYAGRDLRVALIRKDEPLVSLDPPVGSRFRALEPRGRLSQA